MPISTARPLRGVLIQSSKLLATAYAHLSEDEVMADDLQDTRETRKTNLTPREFAETAKE